MSQAGGGGGGGGGKGGKGKGKKGKGKNRASPEPEHKEVDQVTLTIYSDNSSYCLSHLNVKISELIMAQL